ncbi:M23 family metallopeptidase, partial [Candidatus Omnitrophota bacterium]
AAREAYNEIKEQIQNILRSSYAEISNQQQTLEELTALYREQAILRDRLEDAIAEELMADLNIELQMGYKGSEVSSLYEVLERELGIAERRENVGNFNVREIFTRQMRDVIADLQKRLGLETTDNWNAQTAQAVTELISERKLTQYYIRLIAISNDDAREYTFQSNIFADLESMAQIIRGFQAAAGLSSDKITGEWNAETAEYFYRLVRQTMIGSWREQRTDALIAQYREQLSALQAEFPVEGRDVLDKVTSRFGLNTGINISIDGQTDIHTMADGIVESIQEEGGYTTITVNHGNGIKSVYSHLGGVKEGIEVGNRVGLRTVIATASDSYIHFKVLINGIAVDPLDIGIHYNLEDERRIIRQEQEMARYNNTRQRLIDTMEEMDKNTQAISLEEILEQGVRGDEFETQYFVDNPEVKTALKAFEDRLAELDEKGLKKLIRLLRENQVNIGGFIQNENSSLLGGIWATISAAPGAIFRFINPFDKPDKYAGMSPEMLFHYLNALINLELARLDKGREIKNAYLELFAAQVRINLFEGRELPQELVDIWQQDGYEFDVGQERYYNIGNDLLDEWQAAQVILIRERGEFQDIVSGIDIDVNSIVPQTMSAAALTQMLANITVASQPIDIEALNSVRDNLGGNFIARILRNTRLQIGANWQSGGVFAPTVGAAIGLFDTEAGIRDKITQERIGGVDTKIELLIGRAADYSQEYSLAVENALNFTRYIQTLREYNTPFEPFVEWQKAQEQNTEVPETQVIEITEPEVEQPQTEGTQQEETEQTEATEAQATETTEPEVEQPQTEGTQQEETPEVENGSDEVSSDRPQVNQEKVNEFMLEWSERIDDVQKDTDKPEADRRREMDVVMAEARSYEQYFSNTDEFDGAIEMLETYFESADKQKEEWFKRYLAAILMGREINAPPTTPEEAAALPTLESFQGYSDVDALIKVVQARIPQTTDVLLNEIIETAIRESDTFDLNAIISRMSHIQLQLASNRGVKVDTSYFIGLVTLRLEIQSLSEGEISAAQYGVAYEALMNIVDAQLTASVATVAYINYLKALSNYQTVEAEENRTPSQELRFAEFARELEISKQFLPDSIREGDALEQKEAKAFEYTDYEDLISPAENMVNLNTLIEQVGMRILYENVQMIRDNKSPWVFQLASEPISAAVMLAMPLVNKFINWLSGPDKDAIRRGLNDMVDELEGVERDKERAAETEQEMISGYMQQSIALDTLERNLLEVESGSEEEIELQLELISRAANLAILESQAGYMGIGLPEDESIESIESIDVDQITGIETRVESDSSIVSALRFRYRNGVMSEVITVLTSEGRLVETRSVYTADGSDVHYISSEDLRGGSQRFEISGNADLTNTTLNDEWSAIKAISNQEIPLELLGQDEIEIGYSLRMTRLENEVSYYGKVGSVYRLSFENGNRLQLPIYVLIDQNKDLSYFVNFDYYSNSFSLNTGLYIRPVPQDNGEESYEVTGLVSGRKIFRNSTGAYQSDVRVFYEDTRAGIYSKINLGQSRNWRMNFGFDADWDKGMYEGQVGMEKRVANRYFVGAGLDIDIREDGFPEDGEYGFSQNNGDNYRIRPYARLTIEENLGFPQFMVESKFAGMDDYELKASMRKTIIQNWLAAGLYGDLDIEDGKVADYSIVARLLGTMSGNSSWNVDTRFDNEGWKTSGINLRLNDVVAEHDLSLRGSIIRDDSNNKTKLNAALGWLFNLGKGAVLDTQLYGQSNIYGLRANLNFSGSRSSTNYFGGLRASNISRISGFTSDNSYSDVLGGLNAIDTQDVVGIENNPILMAQKTNPGFVTAVQNLLAVAEGDMLDPMKHQALFESLQKEDPKFIEFANRIVDELRDINGRELDISDISLSNEYWQTIRALWKATQQPINFELTRQWRMSDRLTQRDRSDRYGIANGDLRQVVEMVEDRTVETVRFSRSLDNNQVEAALGEINTQLQALSSTGNNFRVGEFIENISDNPQDIMPILAMAAAAAEADLLDEIVPLLLGSPEFMDFFFVNGYDPTSAQQVNFVYSTAWYIDENYSGNSEVKFGAYMSDLGKVITLAEDLWARVAELSSDWERLYFYPIKDSSSDNMYMFASTYVTLLFDITGNPQWDNEAFLELTPWAADLFDYLYDVGMVPTDPGSMDWDTVDAFYRIFGIYIVNQPVVDINYRTWLYDIVGDTNSTVEYEEATLDIEAQIYEGYGDELYKQEFVANTVVADELNTEIQLDSAMQDAITAIFDVNGAFDPLAENRLYRTFLFAIVSDDYWEVNADKLAPSLGAAKWMLDNLGDHEDLLWDILEDEFDSPNLYTLGSEVSFNQLRMSGFGLLAENILFSAEYDNEGNPIDVNNNGITGEFLYFDETTQTFDLTLLGNILDAVTAMLSWSAAQKATFDQIFAAQDLTISDGINSTDEFTFLINNILFSAEYDNEGNPIDVNNNGIAGEFLYFDETTQAFDMTLLGNILDAVTAMLSWSAAQKAT